MERWHFAAEKGRLHVHRTLPLVFKGLVRQWMSLLLHQIHAGVIPLQRSMPMCKSKYYAMLQPT